MKKGLLREARIKYIAGIILMAVLLFLPAGTLKWKEGWLFMAGLFIPMCIAGIIMYLKAPGLLQSRLNAREKESEQQDVVKYSGLMFLAAFVVAGLNFRFHWIHFPDAVVIIGCIRFLLSYRMFGEVMRENEYLSRTIEVQENQTVVDTGLYGIVRHPMYSATVILFLSMPLILNSSVSFIIMLVYIPLIVKRIRNEEEFLDKELNGYSEYRKKVKYRILPFIW